MGTWRSWLKVMLVASASACAQGISPEEGIEDASGPIATDDASESPDDAASDAAEAPDVDEPELDAGGGASDASSSSDASRDSAATTDSGEAGALDAGSSDGGTRPPDASIDAGNADSSTPDASPPAPDAGNITFGYTPTNLDLEGIDFAGAPNANLNCGVTEIDTGGAITLRNWCGSAPKPITRTQANGPELAVIPLRGLTLAAAATLRAVGPRPVVFVVQGHVAVRGILDVSGRDSTPGAGGNFMCGASAGTDGTADGNLNAAGGGGGGYATRGGAGGASPNCTAGTAGATRGEPLLKPLLGGCAGGKGGGCNEPGGGGGGAVQISAAGTLVLTGEINATGGRGRNGCENDSGGGGGGSGGAVLLEATTMMAPNPTIRVLGNSGGDGNGSGGSAGNGAGNANAMGAAGEASDSNGAGGGGGGYGRVRFHEVVL